MKRTELLFKWDGFEILDSAKSFTFLQHSLETMDNQACNRAIQEKIIKQMQISKGDKILEVGCGLGKLAKRMAETMKNSVFITAIDSSEKILTIAEAQSAASNITYQQADVRTLPFPDNYFNIVTAERLLICFDNPLMPLQEMYRVLKPGGKLVVTDFDPMSVIITPSDELMQKIFMDIYMPSFCNPLIGRQLPELFAKVGIKEFYVEIDVSYEQDISQLKKIIPMKEVLSCGIKAGFLSQNMANNFLKNLNFASKNKYFLYAITVISILGKKVV